MSLLTFELVQVHVSVRVLVLVVVVVGRERVVLSHKQVVVECL